MLIFIVNFFLCPQFAPLAGCCSFSSPNTKANPVNGSHYMCSMRAYRPIRSQVHCVRGKLHQTFMKRQTDIINLSSPPVVNMFGCGGILHSDHS